MTITDLSARDLALRRAYLSQQQSPSALMPMFQYLALHQPGQVSVIAVDEVVAQLATRLMLTDKLTRPLTELSGGEWQRVRLAARYGPRSTLMPDCWCWMNLLPAWM